MAAVRTMFLTYGVVILAGIAFYVVIGILNL